ncbi:MAG: hydantoinase/oxoprolinase family protein [Anaerolineae bacterium]
MHPLILGVDTGGTYTDAVALDTGGAAVASAKALTTRADLGVGIGEAIGGLQGVDPRQFGLACLSTTLATNAIVEGHGGRVCLLLIGYDPELITRFGFERDLVVDDYVFIGGGHDLAGRERAPLDEAALRAAVQARAGRVDAFAISEYLGVRNPEHELRARALVSSLTDCPITCGHELGDELNSIRRATTVALNARLIPLLRELLQALRRALQRLDVAAPLMFVKGDGSLMSAEMALLHPVETVLSGPAASVVGARQLTGRDDLLVVDMGGTTTDLAILRGGRPRSSPQGAWVGGWRTLVRAVDTRSVGLGGDSQVLVERSGEVRLGPERVEPLALAATRHPRLLETLARLASPERLRPGEPRFYALTGRRAPTDLTVTESELLALLQRGACSLEEIAQQVSWGQVYLSYPNRLEASGLVQRISFTPTDALHVLGLHAPWNGEAATLGAEMLGRRLGLSAQGFAAHIRDLVVDRLAAEVLGQIAAEEARDDRLLEGAGARFFLERALHPEHPSALQVDCRLRLPLAAVGAPVNAYFPQLAERLRCELLIPEQAGVANAIGAAAGSVLQTVEVLVEPEYNVSGIGGYTVHTAEEQRAYASLDEAISYAREAGVRLARAAAARAGAEDAIVEEERTDQSGTVAEGRDSLYLGTRLRFTAAGKPRLAVQGDP